MQVFDKESSFDPRADPIVRVQARRLRARLIRYYREEARPGELVLEMMSAQRYVSPFEFASMRFALDQIDVGFRWFEKACQDRSFELLWMRVDPRLDPVRNDERFEAAALQMGLV